MKTLTLIAIASVLGWGLSATGGVAQHNMGTMSTKATTQTAPNMAMCKQMMADKQKMQAHMKDMDRKLDDLVAAMDRASESDKTAAVADVVREMVAQRKMMNAEMAKMDSKMMAHMMQHMSSGKGMGACPMMKGMAGS